MKKFFFFSDNYFDISWPIIEHVFEVNEYYSEEVNIRIENKEGPVILITKCDEQKAKYKITVEEI